MRITRKAYTQHTPTVLAQNGRAENALWRWASKQGATREFYVEVHGPKHEFRLTLDVGEARDLAEFIQDVLQKEDERITQLAQMGMPL